jgi:hypothetical protein
MVSIARLLRGYFSGDGSIHVSSGIGNRACHFIISCSSVSKNLLEGISILLDRLGIRHHISDGYPGGGYHSVIKSYKLSIFQGLAVNRFMDLVGFIQNKPFVRRTSFSDKTGRPVTIRGIKKIEYVGEKAVYGISTASETFVAVACYVLLQRKHAHIERTTYQEYAPNLKGREFWQSW